MEKPNLSKRAFWDIDFESLDYEKEVDWIIGRIFAWGKLSDLKNLIAFFGNEKCTAALKKSTTFAANSHQFVGIFYWIFLKKKSNATQTDHLIFPFDNLTKI